MVLTDLTLIELLEYVRRNATFPGPCVDEAPSATFDNAEVLKKRGACPPCEDVDDTVSMELLPVSDTTGTGGIAFDGARKPFFVVEAEPCFMLKRPLALGADATRRMKRVADALTERGDNGPPERDVVAGAGRGKTEVDALAGGSRSTWDVCRAFSDFVRVRD